MNSSKFAGFETEEDEKSFEDNSGDTYIFSRDFYIILYFFSAWTHLQEKQKFYLCLIYLFKNK